jgi:hypothetical protein
MRLGDAYLQNSKITAAWQCYYYSSQVNALKLKEITAKIFQMDLPINFKYV